MFIVNLGGSKLCHFTNWEIAEFWFPFSNLNMLMKFIPPSYFYHKSRIKFKLELHRFYCSWVMSLCCYVPLTHSQFISKLFYYPVIHFGKIYTNRKKGPQWPFGLSSSSVSLAYQHLSCKFEHRRSPFHLQS